MKVLILVCFLLISAQIDSDAVGHDKQDHFVYSLLVGSVGYAILDQYDLEPWQKFLYGVGIGMIPGVVKELYDSRSGGSGWDNKDLLADLAGASTGSLMMLTITVEF